MKWNSPLFDEIRGTLEPTKTTFRMWKGRRIAEKKPIPRQPRTFKQIYQRAIYKMALEAWKQLSTEEKEYWKLEAGKISLDGHQLFISKYITELLDPRAVYLFEEPTSGILRDYSPYGNNATINGAEWQKLPSGKWALYFDGTGVDAEAPHDESLCFAPDSKFTIMAWAKIDVYPSEVSRNLTITCKENDFLVRFDTSDDQPHFWVYDGTNWEPRTPGNYTPDKNLFHFVVARYNAGYLELDLNCEFFNSATNTKADCSTKTLYIGRRLTSDFFQGHIAFLGIYARDISLNEQRAFYELTKPFFT